MVITLSPAKMLNFTSDPLLKVVSNPLFWENAIELNNMLKNLSVLEIGILMKINPKQALEVYQYIQAFEMDITPQKQAGATYNGIAFAGLEASSFDNEDWMFAQQHLIILSGLYGALRPLDMIKPYRLEMLTKLNNTKGKDLYAYWQDIITPYFNERLNNDDNVWLNLSSNEYSKVIDKRILPKDLRIITPIFKEQTSEGYKQVTVYAKKARGMMARYVIQNKIRDVEKIKLFDNEGYTFYPDLSQKNEWVFIR